MSEQSLDTKYTKTYADLSAAAATNSPTLFSLPAGYMIERIVMQHSQAFGGGGLTAYTVSIGTSDNPTKYTSAFDVAQQPGGAIGQVSVVFALESVTVATAVLITATATSGNLSVATQGSVDITVTTRRV